MSTTIPAPAGRYRNVGEWLEADLNARGFNRADSGPLLQTDWLPPADAGLDERFEGLKELRDRHQAASKRLADADAALARRRNDLTTIDAKRDEAAFEGRELPSREAAERAFADARLMANGAAKHAGETFAAVYVEVWGMLAAWQLEIAPERAAREAALQAAQQALQAAQARVNTMRGFDDWAGRVAGLSGSNLLWSFDQVVDWRAEVGDGGPPSVAEQDKTWAASFLERGARSKDEAGAA